MDRSVVAQFGAAQAGQGITDRRPGGIQTLLALAVQETLQGDVRFGPERALAVEHDGRHGRAIEVHALPGPDRLVAERHQPSAIEGQPTGLDPLEHLGPLRRQSDDFAVLRHQRLRDLAGPGQLRMFGQMPRLAVHGDGDLRSDPLVHLGQFFSGRMAGNVDEMVPVGHNVQAQAAEGVLQAPNGDLVPGNDAGREDDRIPFFQNHMRVLVAHDAPQGGARLALATGAEQQDLVARQVAKVFDPDRRLNIGQVAGVACRLEDPQKRPTDQGDPAAVGRGSPEDRFDPGNVGGKTGDRHPALLFADQPLQVLADLSFGARIPLNESIRGIADHGQHPLAGETAKRRLVVVGADQRVGVEFPVAGMQDRARACPQDHGVGLRDRMGQGDQLELEGAYREAA